MNQYRVIIVIVLGMALSLSGADSIYGQSEPRVFLLNAKALSKVKQAIAAGDTFYQPALRVLVEEAEQALSSGPYSVMQKKMIPPSGDKHDYMSMGPYWWPNPDTPDGLPYIRRDGQVNPERNAFDKIPGAAMCEQSLTLALAYYLTGNEAYAAHAAGLIQTWFLNDSTRMNPHLNFGQHIPGRTQGRGVGIIETRNFIQVIDAVGLLAGSHAWTVSEQAALEQWFGEYLQWLLNSDIGLDEAARENNHGTWYDVQVACFAMFAKRPEIAREILSKFPQKRIVKQIEPDGRQPLELERTRAFTYSVMNLAGHFAAATLAERIGIDIWHYESADGRSIRRALDYLLPFASGEREWPYQQITGWEAPRLELVGLLREAVEKYPDQHYGKAASRIPLKERHLKRYNLLFPPM